jgi:hypothetical protein
MLIRFTAVMREKLLSSSFVARWRGWLELAVEDPDVLWSPDAPEEMGRHTRGVRT